MNLEEKIKAVIRNVPDFPKKGIMFKDITPVFENQQLCSEITDGFIKGFGDTKPDAIVGIESRGFLFGILIANKLNVPFVLVRKAGKLPAKVVSYEYDLEYGSAKIELHDDSIKAGWKVIIHDDLLATGGTAEAAAQLVKLLGAEVMSFTFLVGLDELGGEKKLINHSNSIKCLARY